MKWEDWAWMFVRALELELKLKLGQAEVKMLFWGLSMPLGFGFACWWNLRRSC